MRDFSIHPALRSPLLAGLACALVANGIVDVGGWELLAAGHAMSPEDWRGMAEVRWILMALSFAMGAGAWATLFVPAPGRLPPPVALVAGLVASVGALGLSLSIGRAPWEAEYAGDPFVWRVAALWSFLAAAAAVGGARIAVLSWRALRGRP